MILCASECYELIMGHVNNVSFYQFWIFATLFHSPLLKQHWQGPNPEAVTYVLLREWIHDTWIWIGFVKQYDL